MGDRAKDSLATAPRIVFDGRWRGMHGIGRFLHNVSTRIPMTELNLSGRATAPLGAWHLHRALTSGPKADLFFSPGFIPPWPSTRCPYIITLHDLNHIDVPQNTSPAKQIFYRRILLPASRSASAILTVSEFSRSRILEWTQLREELVVNVGNGVSATFRPEGPVLASDKPYFLVVGLRKAHKNQEGVVRAFRSLANSTDAILVFVGDPAPEISRVLHDCGLEGRARFLGALSEEALAEAYRGALALVLPSFYEGFGMPVVEAMACGCTVISANTTSIPEVAGSAALLVDPHDTEALASAMREIAQNESLRNSLRLAGLQRANSFRWEEVCKKIQATFDRVLAESHA